jgi:transcriptional regulator with XRE-family HTH domain
MGAWDWDDDPNSAAQVGRRIIGAAVREARLGRGLSQRQLAWRSLLAQSTISKLETGRLRGMRLQSLARLFGVLRVGVSLGGLPEPSPPRRRLPGRGVPRDSYHHEDQADLG